MTSPSTLIRRARKAKNPAQAKRLRNQAARLRREQRGKSAKKSDTAAKAAIRKRSGGKPDALAGILGINRSDNPAWRVRQDGDNMVASYGVAEVAGEAKAEPIISGEEIERVRALAKAKHVPNEPDSFAIAMRANLVDAKVRGKRDAEEAHVSLLRTVHEVNALNVVCAFVAEIEGIQALHRGTLPPTLMLSGYTVARVYSALRDAGYTSEGKGGVRRESIASQGKASR